MALPSVMHTFDVDLANIDDGVYESISLRLAKHPSESVPYLMTRVFAASLHHREGVRPSKAGLSSVEEPPLLARDLTGRITTGIEIGAPAPARLHKAMKVADRVVVYSYREPGPQVAAIKRNRVHNYSELEFYPISEVALKELGAGLTRSNSWSLVVQDGQYLVTANDVHLSLEINRLRLD